MQRVYRYRPLTLLEIAASAYLLQGFLGSFLTTLTLFTSGAIFQQAPTHPGWLAHAVYHLIIEPLPVFLIALAWAAFALAARARITVANGCVYYRYRPQGRAVRIALSGPVTVRYKTIPFLFSWIEILTPSRTLRITGLLQEYGAFAMRLKSELDHSAPRGSYSGADYLRALRWAYFWRQASSRAVEWNLGLVLVLFGVLLWLVGEGVSRLSQTGFNGWDTLLLLSPLFAWALAELILYLKDARLSAPLRDPQAERRVYAAVLLLYFLIYTEVLLGVAIAMIAL